MMHNEETTEPVMLDAVLSKENLTAARLAVKANDGAAGTGSFLRGTLQRQRADLGLVQPPYAENRTYGGVEGAQGEIPASPSDL